MLRKKILFGTVWLVAAPLVFLRYCLSLRGSVPAQLAYWRSGLPWTQTGLVRQAVYERLVTQKPMQRQRYNRYRQRR